MVSRVEVSLESPRHRRQCGVHTQHVQVSTLTGQSTSVAAFSSFSVMLSSTLAIYSIHPASCNLSEVRWRTKMRQTTSLLAFEMLEVSIDPTSTTGPRYLPRTQRSLGQSIGASTKKTHWYHVNLHKLLMSAVDPVSLVSGTNPSRSYMVRTLRDIIWACNSRQ